jgi:Cu(I)/Ag(I) efflux system membrane fusion protein
MDLMRFAREKLDLLGISDDQIDEIIKTGKANTHLKIRSPIDGHVIKKYVKEGQYVDEGMPLYDVADLSTIWIQAQLYEDDIAFLRDEHPAAKKAKKEGLPVTATTRAFPGEVFHATLSFIHPHVDPDTRTLIVRFELDNPGHKLRPGMSATVRLKVPPRQLTLFSTTLAEDWAMENAVDIVARSLVSAGRPLSLDGLRPLLSEVGQQAVLHRGLVLAVPESAVIDTGSQRVVYREESPGTYEGVKVELGPRMTGPEDVIYYPVIRGLQPGDLVVAAGSFLVDAETRLNPAAGSIYFGGSGLNKPGQSSTVRPTTPDDEEATRNALLAKMSPADRKLVVAQDVCPIKPDVRLGSMGPPIKVMLKNQPVFLC